jgi:hypothetical protein
MKPQERIEIVACELLQNSHTKRYLIRAQRESSPDVWEDFDTYISDISANMAYEAVCDEGCIYV